MKDSQNGYFHEPCRGIHGQHRFFHHMHEMPHGHGGGQHGGEGHGGGRHGGGRQRFFGRGEFKFALLELLNGSSMHGYQLIKAMEESTGGLYTPSPGSVYPNLQFLEETNLIVSEEEDGKKLYSITEEGRRYLQENRRPFPSRGEGHGEHRHGERPPGGHGGKRELRELMHEWQDVVFLLAKAAKVSQQQADSEQAVQFRDLMDRLRSDLQGMVDPKPSADEPEV
ncbi:PadR family transcriptional regulator [Gorillibacterium sp. CAU 1737]|uniref:PadR family transcriptional regulator n=1 Tax=Gorillibacterium sp. CAU 1737 TaxID=3140362 RepID=UPI0032601401